MPFLKETCEQDKSAKPLRLGDWTPTRGDDPPPSLMIKALCSKRDQGPDCPLFHDIYKVLFESLKSAQEPAFCLNPVLDYLCKVNEIFPIIGKWSLGLFEIWLNAQSDIDIELQMNIRAKIVGRHLPRSAYQTLFPIGGDQIFSGSHKITAHSAPDLDTCIASFWGWSDAFAARLSSQAHIWNLPGGFLAPQDRLIVDQLLGNELLRQLPTSRADLHIAALDLIDTRALMVMKCDETIDLRVDAFDRRIAVMVDERGSYLGDLNKWDSQRLIAMLAPLFEGARWLIEKARIEFGNRGEKGASLTDLIDLQKISFDQIPSIASLAPNELKGLEQLLQSWFQLPAALKTKLPQIAQGAVQLKALQPFALAAGALSELLALRKAALDDAFSLFQKFEKQLIDALKCLHRLDVLIDIKTSHFKCPPCALGVDDELQQVRAELQRCNVLPIVLHESSERATPLGALFASDLDSAALATATLRDFCNGEEISIPPHYQIISVLDHHKAALHTSAVATFSSADVQSCNVLTAELAMQLNDQCAGEKRDLQQLRKTLALFRSDESMLNQQTQLRLLQRVITRCLAQDKPWYVHPEREMAEYLSLLHAIFDDTDLLMKVTPRDVRCVAQLLNRAKSLQCQQQVEIIDEEGLEMSKGFPQKLAGRILQHQETYSLYSKVFAFRAKSIEEAMTSTAFKGKCSWFADTKVQNGCARIGQSKLFARNIETFENMCPDLRARFVEIAKNLSIECDLALHVHMCSTIADADEVHRGEIHRDYPHQDQLWFWLPDGHVADRALRSFLSGFGRAKELRGQALCIEVFNDRNGRLQKIFNEEFAPCRCEERSSELFDSPLAVLYVKAASLNSRKAVIAPYLPSSAATG